MYKLHKIERRYMSSTPVSYKGQKYQISRQVIDLVDDKGLVNDIDEDNLREPIARYIIFRGGVLELPDNVASGLIIEEPKTNQYGYSVDGRPEIYVVGGSLDSFEEQREKEVQRGVVNLLATYEIIGDEVEVEKKGIELVRKQGV